MSVWINEFHYDNSGTDSGEFIEIAGTAGTDLTGYSLVLYNGNPSSGAAYNTLNLSGVIGDQQAGFGTLSFTYASNAIQNGGAGAATEPDGIALVSPTGVVQFISYEGSFTAVGGAAGGMTSTNVGSGVYETGSANGTSIALVGSGAQASDFTWQVSSDTHGAVNTGQTFGGGVVAPSVAISDITVTEGDDGTTNATFTVTRTGGSGAFTVDYATNDGTAVSGSDFTAQSGTLTFAASDTSQTVTIAVTGDTTVEPDEAFTLQLSNPTGGATLTNSVATATITNDDSTAVAGKVWINEFHYDNPGSDAGEFIEVAGTAGTSLTGYSLVLYNGNGGGAYNTLALTGTFTDQGHGVGVIAFDYPVNGLQNGGTDAAPDKDGIALVGPGNHVIEFISYEGTMVATGGPAAGQTSTDVGVYESGTGSDLNTSIARVGEGSEGDEFTWALGSRSEGAVNAGQTFADPAARLHITDASVSEGDAGTQTLTFTVSRTGLTQAVEVHYGTADGTASAGSDYTAVSGTLSFAEGETSKTVSVTVSGDATVEPTETFTLNLSGATNGAVIADGQGVGTIVNDDLTPVAIYQIQGAGHTSEYEGQKVATDGVITAFDTTGFWIQDEHGDGDAATSDAVFVFSNNLTGLAKGDLVHVVGTVDEYDGGNSNNLTITEIGSATVTVEDHGHTIAATEIGGAGLHIPSSVIEDDNYGSFDPQNDALDFYESIEGMLVTVKDAVAVDSTYQGATWVRAGGADEVNSRGGVTITADDPAPEKIQVYADQGVNPGFNATYVMGDHLGDVTGVVSYYGGQYELLPTSVGSTASAGTAPRETTALTGDGDHVTIATYNLENIDPTDPQSKFDQLASDIAHNLGGPDIIGVEEIQDADGAGAGTDYTGTATLQKLVDAIAAAGGPHYQWIEIAPTTNNANGGEGNGNIRQAFLYNADRVTYVDGSAHQLFDTDPTNGDAYNNSRHPLVAQFEFNGETITAIDVHNYSRGGSEESFGLHQPATNSGDVRRIDQTQPVADYVHDLLTQDPSAHVAVMGDFNGFYFEEAQSQLETEGGLYNLTRTLDASERYSYTFEGASQEIDYIYVSPSLTDGSQFDLVHLNTGQTSRPTDHDPAISSLYLNSAPVTAADTYAGTEDVKLTVDAAHGLLANDQDVNGDAMTVALKTGPAHGALTLNADGSFAYTPTANYNGADTFTYVVTDPSGETSAVQTVTLNLASVNDAPVAAADSASVNEDQTVTIDVLANDIDADTGDSKTITAVGATKLGGHVSIEGGKLVYAADADAFDLLLPGTKVVDSFTYTVTDAAGATSTATVNVTVNGVANGAPILGGNGNSVLNGTSSDEIISGGNGNDTVNGLDGADVLSGGNGNDKLYGGNGIDALTGDNGNDYLDGGAGNDALIGLNGNDTLVGGAGDDLLTGGNGSDRFVFSGVFGHDTIVDFGNGDKVQLDHTQFANYSDVMSHAQQTLLGTVITLDADHAITLLGEFKSQLSSGDFIFV